MRKLVLFLTLTFCGLTFLASHSDVKAQLGDGYASSGEACSGLTCGCLNQGSALGKTCPPGLSAELVDCTGEDAANRLCEVMGPNPKITKCVNPSCPTASDCGCSHEVCNGGICGCNNLSSASGKFCSDPELVNMPVACSGSEFLGGQCDSYVGAATINKCVNPLCPTDEDCVCDAPVPLEATPDPGTIVTPTTIPQCFDTCSGLGASCPSGTTCAAVGAGFRCVNPNANSSCGEEDSECWCTNRCNCSTALSQGLTMSCPAHIDGQPGKAVGPIFGGTKPACFQCTSGDCDKMVTPFPTVVLDELEGNKCTTYSYSFGGQDDSNPPPAACSCSTELCCPTCQEPVVVGGTCDTTCNFDVVGPELGGGCACFGGRCNEFTVESAAPYGFDWGSSGGTAEPDESCVQFPNAGVKVIKLNCPGGKTCEKEIVIACNCDEQEKPAVGSSYLYTSWYKLKDDQFHKLDTINDPIPDPVSPYDDDDAQESPDPACDTNDPTDIRCLNLNQAGIVTSLGDPINTNGAPISHRQWNRTTYSKSSQYTPESFLDYAVARKPVHVISDISQMSTLQKDTINILTDDLVIADTTQQGNDILDILEDPARAPYVLIIRGDLTVDHNINVPDPVTSSPLPIAFVVEGGEGATGDLNIHHSVQTMGGVFISDTLDFSYDSEHSPYPLKIKGNIISYAAANPLKRNRVDDQSKPSVFVVFDPILYLNIMDLLSVRTYDWSEITQ